MTHVDRHRRPPRPQPRLASSPAARLGTATLAMLAALAALAAGCSLPHQKAVTPVAADRAGTLSGGYGLAVGTVVPDAALTDAVEKPVSLRGVFAKRPVVLVFYRGGWCPYCNFQLHELATKAEEFRRRGVAIVAISVDKPQFGAKTAQENAAAFEVLSDPDMRAHRAFRVVNHIGDGTAFALARMGEDLEKRSGRSHHDVAVPSIFLIDAGGTIRWAHADPSYKVRPSAATVLAAIDSTGIAAMARAAADNPTSDAAH